MSESTEKISLLVLGWLLGLLGPVIVDAIRNRRDAERGREAILSELKQLALVLVFATYRARLAAGTLDRPFLEWLQDRLVADSAPEALSLLKVVRGALAFSDDQIVQGSTVLATAEDKATILQLYPAPLLDARVSALWTFDTSFQRLLLEVHRNIALLDAIVNLSREFYRLTFSSMSSDNHQLVSGNLRQSYGNYAERSKIIVDQIVVLQSHTGSNNSFKPKPLRGSA